MRLIIFCFVSSILICILFVLVFFCCCCFDAKLLIKFMSFKYPSKLRFESLNKHIEEQVLERTEVGKQIKFTWNSERKKKVGVKKQRHLETVRKFLLTIYDLTNRGSWCLFISKIECIKSTYMDNLNLIRNNGKSSISIIYLFSNWLIAQVPKSLISCSVSYAYLSVYLLCLLFQWSTNILTSLCNDNRECIKKEFPNCQPSISHSLQLFSYNAE
jgi:hypothetical protein